MKYILVRANPHKDGAWTYTREREDRKVSKVADDAPSYPDFTRAHNAAAKVGDDAGLEIRVTPHGPLPE